MTAAKKKAKQIQVICDDPEARAAFMIFAGDLRDEFRQILHEPGDAWVSPIEIHVSGKPNDVVTGPTAVIPRETKLLPGGRFLFRLYVRRHNGYDQGEVTRRLTQLLFYEMMVRPYSGKPEAFDGKSLVTPHWLIRGFDELMKYRRSGRPSGLYAGIVKSRKILSVAEILARNDAHPLDPVTDAIFAASAAALVAALLDQPNGASSFRGFLAGLPDVGTSDPAKVAALLRRHFPGLRGSPGALEKWWSLQLASMGQLQGLEFFSVAQTETMLDEALAVSLVGEVIQPAEGIRKLLPHRRPDDPFVGRVHEFNKFIDHNQAETALKEIRRKLHTLGMRAFPVYRGLILRYEIAVARLIEGKTRGVEGDLKKLDRERESIHRAMERVDDYMNYYEATQAESRNEAWEQYRKMKNRLERQQHPRRDDRISKYLDSLELEFAKPDQP